MIIVRHELETVLGIGAFSSGITDEERAMLDVVVPAAESKVRQLLQYDPEQNVHTDIVPRHNYAGGSSLGRHGFWDVNALHTKAIFIESSFVSHDTLQLQHIPIREVIDLRVDRDSRHGKAANAFDDDTEWTEGDEFHGDYEQSNVCLSGCLYAYGGWPITTGAVRVQYRAGYSRLELDGLATTSSVDANGVITTAGVDAVGIKRAAMLIAAKAFHTWQQLKKGSQTGFIPGAIQSERLGDYSYTLGANTSEAIAGLTAAVPPEALDELEPFKHYGVLRL